MALSRQLVHLAEQNDWQINQDEHQVYGEYNGYLFTVIEGKGFKSFITPVAGISRPALDELLTYLRENSRALRLRDYEATENFLCVRQNDGLIPLSVDKMDLLLGQLSGLLDLHELPTDACVVCGQPADVRGLYFGLLCALHPECESADMTYYTGEATQDSTETGQDEEINPAGSDQDSDQEDPADHRQETIDDESVRE